MSDGLLAWLPMAWLLVAWLLVAWLLVAWLMMAWLGWPAQSREYIIRKKRKKNIAKTESTPAHLRGYKTTALTEGIQQGRW
jgi:uncharacterized protein HemY